LSKGKQISHNDIPPYLKQSKDKPIDELSKILLSPETETTEEQQVTASIRQVE